MARAVMRKFAMVLALAGAGAGILASVPVSAQMFSAGYEFLKAVKERDGDKVTNTLNQPGSIVVNSRDVTSGETALHIVVQRRDTVWIDFLAARGANPNIADRNGTTPLQVAANLGYQEGVEALIKAGARLDVTNSTGETPLITAVHRRDIAMIRLLLEKGANPDHNDNSGRSARDYAALNGTKSGVLAEFARADEERGKSGKGAGYGPKI